jgi:hypothetical protein
MLVRKGFITNSSSTAYIMYGVPISNDERIQILKHIWFDKLTAAQRDEIAIGHEFNYDIHTDKDNWEELYEDIEYDYGYLDKLHDAFLYPVKLEIYARDDDYDDTERAIIFIPDSYQSVYCGELKPLDFDPTESHLEWDQHMAGLLGPAGIDRPPWWYIIGKAPGT